MNKLCTKHPKICKILQLEEKILESLCKVYKFRELNRLIFWKALILTNLFFFARIWS